MGCQTARQVYENPCLVGQPWVDDELTRPGQAGGENVAPYDNSYAYAVRVREVHFSGAHEGLVLYAARLLRPVWDLPVASAAKKPPGAPSNAPAPLLCRLKVSDLEKLERQVMALQQFLANRPKGDASRWGNLGGGPLQSVAAGVEPRLQMQIRELHKTRRVEYYYVQVRRSRGGRRNDVAKRRRETTSRSGDRVSLCDSSIDRVGVEGKASRVRRGR